MALLAQEAENGAITIPSPSAVMRARGLGYAIIRA